MGELTSLITSLSINSGKHLQSEKWTWRGGILGSSNTTECSRVKAGSVTSLLTLVLLMGTGGLQNGN